jgi:MFS family permease
LAPEYRALTLGLVLTITFVASEALAVAPAVPVLARELGGLRLYGWVFSAFMLASLVGAVVAGQAADKRGPAPPYLVGIGLFVLGLLISGRAQSMEVVVIGRAVQGFGAGAVPAVAYASIGRSLPASLQPRMMAVLSTAWVIPGLFAPTVAAFVIRHASWRWIFEGSSRSCSSPGPSPCRRCCVSVHPVARHPAGGCSRRWGLPPVRGWCSPG